MRLRRVGLVLATVLVVLAVVPAFLIAPDPVTGEVLASVIVAVLSGGIALANLLLLLPAWHGGRRSALAIAALQVVAIVPSVPAFVLPADVVPPDGVVAASVGVLLSAAAVILIVLGLSTAFLYAAAVASVVAVYAALVAVASALVPESAGRVVQTGAAIVVALGFLPLVALLSRAASRVLYGTRDDPERTMLRVGRPSRNGADAVEAAVADTARALRLPGLELRDGERVLASTGSLTSAFETTVPIDDDGLEFRAALRPGERRLHATDRTALELVAVPLGLLVRQARLTAELTSARAAAVSARERERAKIHRDLHDGLGPLLTGAALRADAARNLLAGEQPAGEQLDIVRAEVREAIGEVRRVVEGLRPLDLEQQGVWAYAEKRAARAGATIDLPVDRPELSDATALAVHRILGEAIANAERHAPGEALTVRLEWSSASDLQIEVANAGTPTAGSPGGVGLESMRARAEELGGSFDAGPTAHGWLVRVVLPVQSLTA